MLSSLWNQIVATDDDSSDEEVPTTTSAPLVPTTSRRLDEDDIAADQLLSSFPAFGTNRKKSGEGGGGGNMNIVNNHSPSSSTLADIVESPSNTSSVIASEWENFSPRKNTRGSGETGGGRKKIASQGSDDESTIDHVGYVNNSRNDEERSLQSLNSVPLKEKKTGSGKNNSDAKDADKNNGFWSEEEMNIWLDNNSKKSRRRKNDNEKDSEIDVQNHRLKKGHKEIRKRHKKKGKSQSQEDTEKSVYWDAEFRHRWIHGSSTAVVTPTIQLQTNDTKKLEESSTFGSFNDDLNLIVPTNPSAIKLGKHFTFSFDEAPTESSHSNTTDPSSEEDGEESSVESRSSTSPSLMTGNDDSSHQHDKIIKHYNEKSHWMPDQLCKSCHACEEKFTVFRRRHHCRLCGQVFCNGCSSFFVEIVENGGTKETAGDNLHLNDDGKNDVSTASTIASVINYDQNSSRTVSIRTCKMCYDQVSLSGPNGLVWYGGEMSRIGNDPLKKIGNVDGTNGNIDEHSYSSLSQHIVGFQGGSSKEGEFKNLAIVKEKLEMDRALREKREKATEEQEEKRSEENTVGLISKTISSTFTRRFGRLAESAAREAQIGDTGYNDEETKLIGTGVKNPDNDSNIENESKKEKSSLETTLRPPSIEREISDAANEQSLLDEEKMLKDATRHIGLTAANHLEKLGRQLLRSEAPLLLKEKKMTGMEGDQQYERWVNKLMMLATRCCSVVSPNVRSGDMLDIRPYCKVKGKIF